MRRHVAALVVLSSALVVACSGDGDGPTANGTAPLISQLQVHGAQRLTANSGGLVALSFSYADPDRDVDRVVFRVVGGSTATNPLRDANDVAGSVVLQQAVNLPATGTEVGFVVRVVDRHGNPSNDLAGSFLAP